MQQAFRVTEVGICSSLNDDLLHKKLIWDSVDVGSYFLLIFKTSCAGADRYTRLPLVQADKIIPTFI